MEIKYLGGSKRFTYLLEQGEEEKGEQSDELTPNLQNSIYNEGLIENYGLKLAHLNNHEYPSEFRDTTVIFPRKNEKAYTTMVGMVERGFAIQIV